MIAVNRSSRHRDIPGDSVRFGTVGQHAGRSLRPHPDGPARAQLPRLCRRIAPGTRWKTPSPTRAPKLPIDPFRTERRRAAGVGKRCNGNNCLAANFDLRLFPRRSAIAFHAARHTSREIPADFEFDGLSSRLSAVTSGTFFLSTVGARILPRKFPHFLET
jgi:hypothetical protein